MALRWITYEGHQITRMDFPPSRLGRHPSSYAIYQPAMEEVLRRANERHAVFRAWYSASLSEETIACIQFSSR